MLFNRVANANTARNILNELKIIPKHLLDITNQFGIHTYCFNEKLYPSWIGLFDKVNIADRRDYDKKACFSPNHKSIIIYDWDFDKSEYAFSAVIHEYAHALDYALGSQYKEDAFLSEIDPDIQKGWKKNRGLDWYAKLNSLEYFAQAFMAYFQEGKELYKPKKYYEHTQQELKEKDPDMFYYLKNLING